MSGKEKSALHDVLIRIWNKYPYLRLMQLLGNCMDCKADNYYMEDSTLLINLKLTYPEVFDEDS